MKIRSIKTAVLLFFIYAGISCNQNKVSIDNRIIQEMTKGEEGVPLLHGNTLIFVSGRGVDDKISTSLNQLKIIYNNRYKSNYDSFYSFLQEAIDQEIKFDIDNFVKGETAGFVLSEKVNEEYQGYKINFIQKKYLQKEGDIFTLKRKTDPPKEIYSVLYFLFVNGYKISYDDYLGEYSLKEWYTR